VRRAPRAAALRLVPAILALAVLAAGCVREAGGTPDDPSPTVERRQLTVFAAASLAGAFREIAGDFELAHDGVDVLVNVGPSDGLAAQIQSEGTADVFASASESWMDVVARTTGVLYREDFVRNSLIVILPADNPAEIESLEDLATPGVQLVLAAEGVPVGDYAREVLRNADLVEPVLANVVSNEEDVAAVVAKVSAGEADAGIAYVSDVSVAANTELTSVDIPDDVNVVATYPIAVIAGTDEPELAREFIGWMSTAQGKAVLEDYGFETFD
jgi:molybdate transport system substrate-binding protein